MDGRNKPSIGDNKRYSESHVAESASELLNEGRKLANELYEQGLHKVGDAQDTVKEYSDNLTKKIQENPLASVLIAGGIGLLLASLLKK